MSKQSQIYRGHNYRRAKYAAHWRELNFASSWMQFYSRNIFQIFGRITPGAEQVEHEPLTRKQARIVSSAIQWLGSNVGFCFLEETLKAAGYTLTKIKKTPPHTSTNYIPDTQVRILKLLENEAVLSLQAIRKHVAIPRLTNQDVKLEITHLEQKGYLRKTKMKKHDVWGITTSGQAMAEKLDQYHSHPEGKSKSPITNVLDI